MRIAERKHSIEIQQKTNTDDGGGSYVPAWSKFCSTRAKISDPKPVEKISAEKMGHNITHRVKIRYRTGINSTMRILFGSRYLYIKTVVDPEERKRWLVMTAEEKS